MLRPYGEMNGGKTKSGIYYIVPGILYADERIPWPRYAKKKRRETEETYRTQKYMWVTVAASASHEADRVCLGQCRGGVHSATLVCTRHANTAR